MRVRKPQASHSGAHSHLIGQTFFSDLLIDTSGDQATSSSTALHSQAQDPTTSVSSSVGQPLPATVAPTQAHANLVMPTTEQLTEILQQALGADSGAYNIEPLGPRDPVPPEALALELNPAYVEDISKLASCVSGLIPVSSQLPPTYAPIPANFWLCENCWGIWGRAEL